jgi:hypothetical protein
MAAPTLTLVGAYTRPNGYPSAGQITFTLATPLRSTAQGAEVTTSQVTASLNAQGQLSVVLNVSDGVWSPYTDTVYTVVQTIDGVTLTYELDFPQSLATQTVNLPSWLEIHTEILGAEAQVPDYASVLAARLTTVEDNTLTVLDNGDGTATVSYDPSAAEDNTLTVLDNGDGTATISYGPLGSAGAVAAVPWAAPQVWASAVAYTISPTRSVVTYAGSSYVALKASLGVVPGTDASTWLPIATSGIGKPCADLQVGVSTSINGATAGANTWVDIANTTIAPGTTLPIEVEYDFPYAQVGTNAGQATASQAYRFRIVDDTGAAITGGEAAINFASLAAGTASGTPIRGIGTVTPNSAARTYHVQHQVSSTSASGALFLNDVSPGLYGMVRARFS